jgi:hypothetical protein
MIRRIPATGNSFGHSFNPSVKPYFSSDFLRFILKEIRLLTFQ